MPGWCCRSSPARSACSSCGSSSCPSRTTFLSRPAWTALASYGILTFLGSWNNFLWPLVVATTEDKYTLPVALALYSVGQNQTRYGLLLAGSVVVVLPVLIVFVVLQRHFVRGIATTGLK